MALKIIWSQTALAQLDQIIGYLSNEFGKNVARKEFDRIESIVSLLANFPELGTIGNRDKRVRGFRPIRQLTIFYTSNKKEIIVLRLFDNRQNPKKNPD